MRHQISNLIVILILLGGIKLYSATGTPSNLVVRTDANNYLLVTAVTQTNPVTQGVFSSRTLRTDSTGSLQVVLTGTITPTYPQSIPASTCAAPSLGMSGGATTGIAFTATPSILECIAGTIVSTTTATARTLTVTLQTTSLGVGVAPAGSGIVLNSPNSIIWSLRGGISTPDDGITLLQNSAADNYNRLIFGTNSTSGASIKLSGGSLQAREGDDSAFVNFTVNDLDAQNVILLGSRIRFTDSGANGILNIFNNGGTFGVQLNAGTAAPTVGTCGTGTIAANSRNTTGGFTATGATACTVTFGAPAWSNTPFCVITLRNAPTTSPYISAISTTTFTVSGLTAGDIIAYHCVGSV